MFLLFDNISSILLATPWAMLIISLSRVSKPEKESDKYFFYLTVLQNAKSHSEIHFDVVWLQYDIFAYHYTANVFGVKFTDFSRDPVSAVL